MKRAFTWFIVITLLFSMAGCGLNRAETTAPTVNTEIREFSFSPDFPVELQQYCAPWAYDVVSSAKHDGKIHYYFMSSKGMLIEPKESDPYKWGDSTLIVFPNGQTMLIDAGMAAYAPVLAENLKRMGIERLDYFMVSHPHQDHYGGLIAENSFLDMVGIDTLLYNGVDRGENTSLLYSLCSERNIAVQILKRGDSMEFGTVKMNVLWPLEDANGKVLTKTEAINNYSIVARFDYFDHSSLFVGDLYASGEIKVMAQCWQELDTDLLKVPHHGYATSSSTLFVEMVSPQIAVAMSGYRPIIQRVYESRGVTYLYDRYEGYIHVMSDGTGMTYDTDRNMQ